jgi:hypothetical protein
MWTVCLWKSYVIENGRYNIINIKDITFLPTPPNMMEKYLSFKYTTAVWIYMVRMSYLRKCGVIEGYITDTRSIQEPGYALPLIIGGGNLKVIDQHLYNYNSHYSGASAHKTAQCAVCFMNNFNDLTKKTIDSLITNDSLKKNGT